MATLLLNTLFISDFAFRKKSSAYTSYGVNSKNFQVSSYYLAKNIAFLVVFFERLEMIT